MMTAMQRATWRDTLVDIFAISVMFAAVALHFWDMRSAAPWMVAVVAGRWGATSMAKIAVARANNAAPPARLPSEPPPPAPLAEGAAGAAKIAEPKAPNPLPSSAIVLICVAGFAWAKHHFFRV